VVQALGGAYEKLGSNPGHGGRSRSWWAIQAMVGDPGHGGQSRPWWAIQAMVGDHGKILKLHFPNWHNTAADQKERKSMEKAFIIH